jgi:hypothetical protein
LRAFLESEEATFKFGKVWVKPPAKPAKPSFAGSAAPQDHTFAPIEAAVQGAPESGNIYLKPPAEPAKPSSAGSAAPQNHTSALIEAAIQGALKSGNTYPEVPAEPAKPSFAGSAVPQNHTFAQIEAAAQGTLKSGNVYPGVPAKPAKHPDEREVIINECNWPSLRQFDLEPVDPDGFAEFDALPGRVDLERAREANQPFRAGPAKKPARVSSSMRQTHLFDVLPTGASLNTWKVVRSSSYDDVAASREVAGEQCSNCVSTKQSSHVITSQRGKIPITSRVGGPWPDDPKLVQEERC